MRIRESENPSRCQRRSSGKLWYGGKDGEGSRLHSPRSDEQRGATRQDRYENYVTDTVGLPTLNDIMAELAKPGRDPRESFEPIVFSDEIREPKDLKVGMRLQGVVTNVTNFGAFVDIGVHQDGLVHVSQLADKFVQNPMDVVKVNQRVNVRVLEVDLPRNRISLSMKSEDANPKRESSSGKRTSPSVVRSGKHKAQLPKVNKNSPFAALANFKVR